MHESILLEFQRIRAIIKPNAFTLVRVEEELINDKDWREFYLHNPQLECIYCVCLEYEPVAETIGVQDTIKDISFCFGIEDNCIALEVNDETCIVNATLTAELRLIRDLVKIEVSRLFLTYPFIYHR
ncbi:MAG: hypothetical protein U0517_01340 [Candidatus Andersenbacteria bacterium]